MKKILCPTDFSETAMTAVSYAAKLAQKTGAELTLFHVHSLITHAPEELLAGGAPDTLWPEEKLDQLCDEVRKVFKVSCHGDVAASLTTVTKLISQKGEQFDMIVMGSNGPDDLAQFFLGSKTYQVIRKSSTPLLLIPDGCGFSEIKSIVYAYDYWRNDQLPLSQLVALAKAMGSDLRILQAMEESYSRRAEMEIKGQQDIYRDLYGDVPLKFDTIHTSDLAESLDRYVLDCKADVLALCTEHHGFLQKLFHKSVIKELSRRATYPLIVFHK